MAYIQRSIPSPNRIYSFNLNDFVGGLNNRSQILEENQCSDVMNMSFSVDGVMQKRKGVKAFDDLVLDGEVVFIDEFQPHNEDNMLIRATKTKLYMGNVVLKELTGQVYGVNHDGKYFFCDGSGIYVYGRFKEEAGTYVKIIGTQTQDYVLMTVVKPPDNFTPLADTHVQGVRNIDFTNRKVWYEPCNQEIKDTFKGANVIPEKPQFIISKGGRLFLSGSEESDDEIFLTDVDNPYYFPAVLPLKVPPTSDRITGLAVFDDAVVVGRRLDIHAITGTTNRTDMGLPVFRVKRLNSHFGFANHRSVVNAHNYLFFLGSDSQFYALSNLNATSDVLVTQVISKTIDIHLKPIDVKKEDIWSASGVYFKDCYYVAVGDKVLVYSYLHRAWTVYDNINATCFHPVFDILLIGTKEGKVVIEGDNYLDLGKPYKGYWKSKYFDMDDANAFKMFRDFFIISRGTEGYSSDVHMLFEVDYADVSRSASVESKHSVYGKTTWGERYISRDTNVSLPFMIYARGRQIRITFSNGNYISHTVETLDDLADVVSVTSNMYVFVTSENAIYSLVDGDWVMLDEKDYDQGMSVLQLSGEYEFKWKR